MAIFLVTYPAGKTFREADAMLVSASNSADALVAASSRFGGDSDWASGTATQLSDVALNGANALVGWTFRVIVSTLATGAVVADVTVTGDATTDTLDEVGAALVVALNATTPISAATYTGATQTLVVAAIADGLGDKHVRLEILPPVVTAPYGQVNKPLHHSGLVTSITHLGIAAADLTVVFVADTIVVPRVLALAALK